MRLLFYLIVFGVFLPVLWLMMLYTIVYDLCFKGGNNVEGKN